MKLSLNFKIGIVILTCVLISLSSEDSLAVFNLSATPYEGGYDLRYGKVDATKGRINKELIVDINTDINNQYRLIQVLQEPLTNTQGVRIPQDSFLVYAIRGSNKYGTLSAEAESPVFMGRMIIYTSNQQGTSDSFNLVYSLIIPADQEPGSYRGQLRFTLEPIGSTQSPSSAIINILAEVEAESRFRITTSSGGRIIQLKTYPQEKRCFDVGIDILGGTGRQFSILQLLSGPLISSEGNMFDLDLANFVVQGGEKGIPLNSPTPLSLQQQTIYASATRGQQADSFVITYSLGDLGTQRAGSYRGKIKYLLQAPGMTNPLIDILDLEIDNPELFELVITPELGVGFLRFDNLKPTEPPRISQVDVEIKTNIGKPYQVSQKVASLFTSKEGRTIPGEYFSLRTESVQTKGSLRYPEKQKVKLGDMVLFISDEQGSPDKFKIIYELNIPLDLKAGDYSTQIAYSITAI